MGWNAASRLLMTSELPRTIRGVDAAHLGDMEQVQVLRQLGHLRLLKYDLHLDHVVLKIGEGALQEHLAPAEDAHVVAHVFQFRRLWEETSTVVPRWATSPMSRDQT